MYQWVEKVYEAQVWNDGQRMMFDVIVPEPASLFLHAVASQPVAGANVVKPVPFTKTAHDLNEVNYFAEVQRYDVQGVEPPPEPCAKIAKTFEGADDRTDRGAMTAVGELPIPEGYSAVSAVVSVAFNEWKEDASIHVMLGSAWHAFEAKKKYVWSPSLSSHPGMIPIALRTFGVAVYAAVFDIHCVRSARAMDAWRLKTHAAIKQGYLKQLQDYEEKVTAAKNQAAESAAQTRAPADNRAVERTELKRLAIYTLTAQHFDTFGAIEKGAFGYPQIDLAEADDEGRYIRFFEQAFEWEHMMYVFYPYFWGRKAGWRASALRHDDDAQFAEFLRAGAARVVLPVRPGFELAMAHFQETGQIWQGGNPPLVTSPLYLSIVDEIKERTGAPGTEVAQGEPWEVRVPTTLVTLRSKPGLPSWSKGEDGAWKEDG